MNVNAIHRLKVLTFDPFDPYSSEKVTFINETNNKTKSRAKTESSKKITQAQTTAPTKDFVAIDMEDNKPKVTIKTTKETENAKRKESLLLESRNNRNLNRNLNMIQILPSEQIVSQEVPRHTFLSEQKPCQQIPSQQMPNHQSEEQKHADAKNSGIIIHQQPRKPLVEVYTHQQQPKIDTELDLKAEEKHNQYFSKGEIPKFSNTDSLVRIGDENPRIKSEKREKDVIQFYNKRDVDRNNKRKNKKKRENANIEHRNAAITAKRKSPAKKRSLFPRMSLNRVFKKNEVINFSKLKRKISEHSSSHSNRLMNNISKDKKLKKKKHRRKGAESLKVLFTRKIASEVTVKSSEQFGSSIASDSEPRKRSRSQSSLSPLAYFLRKCDSAVRKTKTCSKSKLIERTRSLERLSVVDRHSNIDEVYKVVTFPQNDGNLRSNSKMMSFQLYKGKPILRQPEILNRRDVPVQDIEKKESGLKLNFEDSVTKDNSKHLIKIEDCEDKSNIKQQDVILAMASLSNSNFVTKKQKSSSLLKIKEQKPSLIRKCSTIEKEIQAPNTRKKKTRRRKLQSKPATEFKYTNTDVKLKSREQQYDSKNVKRNLVDYDSRLDKKNDNVITKQPQKASSNDRDNFGAKKQRLFSTYNIKTIPRYRQRKQNVDYKGSKGKKREVSEHDCGHNSLVECECIEKSCPFTFLLKYVVVCLMVILRIPSFLVVSMCWCISFPLRPNEYSESCISSFCKWIKNANTSVIEMIKTVLRYKQKDLLDTKKKVSVRRIPLRKPSKESQPSHSKSIKRENKSVNVVTMFNYNNQCENFPYPIKKKTFSLKKTAVPNPYKEYTLYCSKNRGWVMKPSKSPTSMKRKTGSGDFVTDCKELKMIKQRNVGPAGAAGTSRREYNMHTDCNCRPGQKSNRQRPRSIRKRILCSCIPKQKVASIKNSRNECCTCKSRMIQAHDTRTTECIQTKINCRCMSRRQLLKHKSSQNIERNRFLRIVDFYMGLENKLYGNEGCDMYMQTLQKRRCFSLYKCSPQCYYCCISLLQTLCGCFRCFLWTFIAIFWMPWVFLCFLCSKVFCACC